MNESTDDHANHDECCCWFSRDCVNCRIANVRNQFEKLIDSKSFKHITIRNDNICFWIWSSFRYRNLTNELICDVNDTNDWIDKKQKMRNNRRNRKLSLNWFRDDVCMNKWINCDFKVLSNSNQWNRSTCFMYWNSLQLSMQNNKHVKEINTNKEIWKIIIHFEIHFSHQSLFFFSHRLEIDFSEKNHNHCDHIVLIQKTLVFVMCLDLNHVILKKENAFV